MPTLTMDIREQQDAVNGFKAFVPQNFPDWTLDVRLIDVGDFAVGSSLGLEHKAPPDFLASIASGRLFAQAQELAGAYERAFIVVDGNQPDMLWGSWNRIGPKATRAAIASLACHFGTPVLFAGPQRNDYMYFVLSLAEKSQGDSSFHYSPLRRKASSEEQGAHLLGGLPGIGRKRAQAIIAAYGSPLAALNNYKRWSELDGIGSSTVEKCGSVLEPTPNGPLPPAGPS